MKKKNIMALAGGLAVFAIGGSLAYFNQTMEVENNFNTAKYSTTVVEDFKPSEGKDWEPGTEVNKDVLVKNTGDVDVIVRVNFQEVWEKDGEVIKKITTEEKKTAGKGQEGAQNKFENVYQANVKDGEITDDDSVVIKTMDLTDWVYSDGYYYYMKNLEKGNETSAILDAVKLADDADFGDFAVKKYYAINDEQENGDYIWTEFPKADNGVDYITEEELQVQLVAKGEEIAHLKSEAAPAANSGYSGANYTLTVTAQTVQASKDAINAIFAKEGETTFTMPTGCNWTLK